jgi:hypothetical protein
MHALLPLLFAGTLAGPAGSPPAAAPSGPADTEAEGAHAQPVLLGLHEVGRDGLGYEVTAGPCAGERAVEVRILRRGAPLAAAGTVRLPLGLPCALTAPRTARSKGTAAPFTWHATGVDAATGARATGELVGSVLPVGAAGRALLLAQTGGRPVQRRAWTLVGVRGKKLVTLWSEEDDGVAPTATALAVETVAGAARLRLTRAMDFGRENAEAPDPDHFEAELVTWNDRKGAMERSAAPLSAAVFGEVADVAAGRALRAGLPAPCAALAPLVVEAARFPALRAKTPYVVAAFAADERAGKALKTAAPRCRAAVKPAR